MSSLSGLPTYPQLSDINYAEWCINTKALLQSQKLWRLVSGTLKKPDETKFKSPPTEAQLSSLEDWEDRSERACGILAMSISPGQKPNITDCQDDPVAIWTKLKSVHEAQKPSNRFNAYEDLLSIRKDSDESLSSLINRTESCMQLIKNLRTKSFTLDKLDEELQCMALIRALPDEFDSFASTLMITDKLDKASLISAFYSEEIQCSRRAIASANVAKASKASSKFFCTFHNQQTNHPSEKCYFNPAFTGPRPPWWNQNASTTSNTQQAHAASSTTHSTLPASPTTPAAHAFVVSQLPLPSAQELKTKFWNADTGATAHMTPHRHWLSNYRPFRIPVELADKEGTGKRLVYSAGIGTCTFTPTINGISSQLLKAIGQWQTV
ncbi:hypothetical protein HWV62_3008 [Athelia sp. TMB]|nr:hypothetical protein HWV62_3008 [Athelia sp. TMB]